MNKMTMKEAKQLGLAKYFTGKPCLRGHIAVRAVRNRACCECERHRDHLWKKNNPEKVNAQKRSWRNRNIEKARALNLANQKLHRDSANVRNRRYAMKNRDKIAINAKRWSFNNPGKRAEIGARRRSSESRQMPVWADRQSITDVYTISKAYRRMGHDVHVDHIIPLQGRNACGLHVHTNLQIIDATYNRMKANILQE